MPDFQPKIKYEKPISSGTERHKFAKKDLENEFENWKESIKKEVLNSTTLINLITSKVVSSIKYYDLLDCLEWKEKRLRVIYRDKFKCRKCGKLDFKNHVHHKIYLKNKLPWEISEKYLETLCRDCHYEVHRNEVIKIYEEYRGRFSETSYDFIFCPRCNGTNYLPNFKHVENGICFLCKGASVKQTIFENRLSKISNNRSGYSSNSIKVSFKKFIDQMTISEYCSFNYDEGVDELIEKKSNNIKLNGPKILIEGSKISQQVNISNTPLSENLDYDPDDLPF